MKKIVGLVIAFLIAVAMLSMGTWAYFSDVETSTNNILSAGTLDLVPSSSGTGPSGKYTVTPGGNGVNGNVVFQKLLPGESGTSTWLLTNGGSLGGTLAISSTVSFSDVSQNEIENAVAGNDVGGNGDLDQYMGVKVQRGVGTDQADAEANFSYILGSAGNYVPLSGLQSTLNAESVGVAATGSTCTVVYKLSWSIADPLKDAGVDGLFGTGDDTTVNDNIIQSDSAQIDITFTLNE